MSFWSWGEPALHRTKLRRPRFGAGARPPPHRRQHSPNRPREAPRSGGANPKHRPAPRHIPLARTPARSPPARKSWASRSARHDEKSAPSRRDVDLAHARQQTDAPTEPEAPPDASPPKWSEPTARALWSAAHRISDPRQLGERLKRRLPAFRDALTHVPVRPGSRRIALTIDDAPSDLLGPVLDALKACGVKATFFVIADFCSRLRAAAAAGASGPGGPRAGQPHVRRRFVLWDVL